MNRTRAREVALKRLYAYEQGGEATYKAALQMQDADADETIEPQAEDERFCSELFLGVQEYQPILDKNIVEQSRGWTLERIGRLDRMILRLAIFEMLYREDIPVSVSINEAVELAKAYGAEDRSGAFVNGVLASVSKKIANTSKNVEA